MKQAILTITENRQVAKNTYHMVLSGDASGVTAPGQFVDIRLDGFFLRRPISVSDACAGKVSLLYKIMGKGTDVMSGLPAGVRLNVLTGLGNGFDITASGDKPLLIGGGIGSAPMLMLSRLLMDAGKQVTAVLGFNTGGEAVLEDELKALGVRTIIMTADGSYGKKGFVTDALNIPGVADSSYFYACGPMPMLKALDRVIGVNGEYSLEERMGCGFGACMGCSITTKSGYRRVCKDGPVFKRNDIILGD